ACAEGRFSYNAAHIFGEGFSRSLDKKLSSVGRRGGASKKTVRSRDRAACFISVLVVLFLSSNCPVSEQKSGLPPPPSGWVDTDGRERRTRPRPNEEGGRPSDTENPPAIRGGGGGGADTFSEEFWDTYKMGRKDSSSARAPVEQHRKQIGKQDYKKTRPMLKATRLKAEAKKTAPGMKVYLTDSLHQHPRDVEFLFPIDVLCEY
uniref:Triple QxxK/R motif-containing protein n=1 Tax=Podarcis muralis TaxID=64176 RepID=A0A670IDD3_PODMU